MDEVWKTLIQAAPWGFVIIVMRYLEIKTTKDERIERAANAAQKAKEDREHEIEKNKLWSETIKNILDRQAESSKAIVEAIAKMERDLQEKYESMGITKDLLDAARRELSRSKKNE